MQNHSLATEDTFNLIKKIDKYNVLSNKNLINDRYLHFVGSLIQIVKNEQISLDKLVLIEVGAAHHEDNKEIILKKEWEFLASFMEIKSYSYIAQFFSFQEKIEYYAFDIAFDKEDFIKRKNTSIVHPIDKIPKYKEKILDANIETYDNISKIVDDSKNKKKIPIIFSNEVLTSPNLDRKLDFWNLPVYQIHNVALIEFADIYNTGYMLEFMKEEDKSDEKRSHIYMREAMKNPDENIRRFKNVLNLDKNVKAEFTPENERVIYHWK